jgi:hypothetical protein
MRSRSGRWFAVSVTRASHVIWRSREFTVTVDFFRQLACAPNNGTSALQVALTSIEQRPFGDIEVGPARLKRSCRWHEAKRLIFRMKRLGDRKGLDSAARVHYAKSTAYRSCDGRVTGTMLAAMAGIS